MQDQNTTSSPEPKRVAPPHWLRSLLVFGLFLAAGAFLGTGIGRFLNGIGFQRGFLARLDLVLLPFWLLALVAVICFFLAITFHELGHALGGRLVGFRFYLLVVGPVLLIRQGERIHLRLNRSLSGAGGLTASLPVDQHKIDRRYGLVVLSGPLTSLFLGALGLWAACGLPIQNPGSPWLSLTFFALFCFGLMNLLLFLVTVIPYRYAGLDSDGAQLLDLLWGGTRTERKKRLLAFTAQSWSGVRPRDWDAANLQCLLELRSGLPEDALIDLLVYYQSLDRGDIALAGEYLSEGLKLAEQALEQLRPAFYLETAFFQAAYQENPEHARQMYEQARGGLAEAHTRLRAEAAVLLAEGRIEEGCYKAREALRLAPLSSDRGSAQAEMDWLAALLQRCPSRDTGFSSS